MVPTALRALAVVLVALLLLPRQAQSQGVAPATAGAVAGAVAGTAVTAGWLAVEARRGDYLWRPAELVGPLLWPSAAGAVAGATLGSLDAARLGRSMGGAAVGWAVGAAAGYFLGRIGSQERHRWQGFLIGGAVGIVAGWAVGALLDDDGDATAAPLGGVRIRIPLGGS